MPISATGSLNKPGAGERRIAGFSLIEVMVVTAILGIVSISAVLSLRLAPGQGPAARLETLARGIRFIQDEALMTRRSFALSFAGSGWHVLEYDPRARDWRPRADHRPHASGEWGGGTDARLTIEGRPAVIRERAAPEPDILLLSSGESTPFSLELFRDGYGARCTLGAFGEMTCGQGA